MLGQVEGLFGGRVGLRAGDAGSGADPERPRASGVDAIEIWELLGPVRKSADPLLAASTGPAADPPGDPPPPRPPPAIVMSLPLDGETIGRVTPFRVQFSKDMDEESFAGRVVLRYAVPRPGDREFDGLSLRYEVDLMTLNVNPGNLLQPGRTVGAAVPGGDLRPRGNGPRGASGDRPRRARRRGSGALPGERLIRGASMRRTTMVLATISFLTTNGSASARQAERVPPDFPAGVELVLVDVVVLDGDGRPVDGLSRDDFVVREDGTPQTVVSFRAVDTLAATPSLPLPISSNEATASPTARLLRGLLRRPQHVASNTASTSSPSRSSTRRRGALSRRGNPSVRKHREGRDQGASSQSPARSSSIASKGGIRTASASV